MKQLSNALTVAALILLCADRAYPLQSVSSAKIQSVYSALSDMYYEPISPSAIADGARTALLTKLHERGAELPSPRAGLDATAALSYIRRLVDAASHNGKLKESAALDVALHGMAGATRDPYTQFLSGTEYKSFMAPLDPQHLSGVGVVLDPTASPADSARTYFVEPNTPADKAGISAGDSIVSVDGTSTKGLQIEQITKLLRGPAGTQVRAIVASGSEPSRQVTMTRSDLRAPTVYFSEKDGIGYIYVAAFSNTSAREAADAIDRLEQQHVRAYVLDLRFNGGGYVQAALDLANDFVMEGPLVTIKGRTGPVQTVEANGRPLTTKPVAVLVNHWSASASEIAAAALQENRVAVLVGTRTYGKGVMQTMRFIGNDAMLKVTAARYLTPENHDINKRGIVPDITVESTKADRFGDAQHDTQLAAALKYLGEAPE